MISLKLIGIGAGNPRHLTLEAIDALNACDVILIPEKDGGREDLAALRRAICADVLREGGPDLRGFAMPERDPAIADYAARVEHWHDAIAERWRTEIAAALPDGTGQVGFLVWGDPSLYDSTLRIAARLALPVEVIPGITALQALTAGHAIPLNTVGGPVTITTGRRLRDGGWPDGAETVAVMLDAGGAFDALVPEGLTIWWSAYAGMPQELRLSGPLAETAPRIRAAREKARAEHGWIMDIYLIRRS